MGLKEQCVIIKHICYVSMKKDINTWQSIIKTLQFCCHYLILGLTNNTNVIKWKLFNTNQFSLCFKPQLHAFNHCFPALERYMCR